MIVSTDVELISAVGIRDGFTDAANLLDMDKTEGSTIRIRRVVGERLSKKGFPYFAGYTRGHELFSDYLGSRTK